MAAPESGKPAALAWRLRLVGLLSVPVALAPVDRDVAGGSGPGASVHSFLGSSWEGRGEKNQGGVLHPKRCLSFPRTYSQGSEVRGQRF